MSVTITAKVKRTTERAVLVTYDDEDIWLPLSQIEYQDDSNGDLSTLTISDWIARQKNITEGIAEERFAVERPTNGSNIWVVKDMGVNPIRIVCSCSTERDAMIISAALEMTKNKTL